MSHALFITAIGMTIVFLVLALIFGSILILGWFERKFPVPAQASAAILMTGSSFTSTAEVSPEEEAAVHAAIAHHTGRAPETFQIRISPDKKES